MTKVFSYLKFYQDLNRTRKMRANISWNKVATRAGLARSGMSIFVNHFETQTDGKPRGLSVENVVKLLNWMGKTDLAPYMVDEDDPSVVDTES